MDAFQGVTLTDYLLWPVRLGFLGPCHCKRWRDSFWSGAISRKQIAIWNTLLTLFCKSKPIHLPWNCILKARLLVWHNLGTCRGALRGWRPVDTILSFPSSLAPGYWYLLGKGVCPLIWHHEFWGCHPGDTPSSPGSHIQLGLCSWSHGSYTFAYFRSCCLRVWLPMSFKSRCCLRSSPLGLTGLGTTVTKNKGH